MTIEDWLLRLEGLDPDKIKSILNSIVHFTNVVEAELPRIKQLTTDLRAQIQAYEAKQKEYQR